MRRWIWQSRVVEHGGDGELAAADDDGRGDEHGSQCLGALRVGRNSGAVTFRRDTTVLFFVRLIQLHAGCDLHLAQLC